MLVSRVDVVGCGSTAKGNELLGIDIFAGRRALWREWENDNPFCTCEVCNSDDDICDGNFESMRGRAIGGECSFKEGLD